MPGSFDRPIGGKTNNFTRGPGHKTRNSPTIGQNLPNRTGRPQALNTDRTMIGRGPRILGLSKDLPTTSGPGEPPDGFVGGTTSLSEWYLYWAMEKILTPLNIHFEYQEAQMGGRQRAGGAVVDYVIYLWNEMILVRLQTYRFHFNVDPGQMLYDYLQLLALYGDDVIVIDVYEQDFIFDESGQAAIDIVLDIVNHRWRPNPLAIGNVIGTG